MPATRDESVHYLVEDPGENGECYLDEPPCPACHHGWLMRDIVDGGEMLTCTGTAGCGRRFWLDRPELRKH